MSTDKKPDVLSFLEGISTDGAMSFGSLLESIRIGELLSDFDFAAKLGMGIEEYSQIKKGQVTVSESRAEKLALKLGYSPEHFIRLSK